MTAAAAPAAYDKAETRRAIDAVDLADLARRDGVHLQRVGRLLQGCCPLPNHEDHTASFTVYPQGEGWCCFGCGAGGDAARYIMLTRGCTFPAALAYLGIGDAPPAPLVPLAPRPASTHRKASSAPPTRPADVVYPYQDADGVERYQVLRWNLTPDERPRYDNASKLIRHGGPDGRRGMPAGIDPLIYRLPEVIAADPAQRVFIPEGEKDADRLAAAGLVSTCNSGGAGKWPAACSSYLTGRHVVILPDNDEAGRRHAALVADALQPYATSVKVLALPGLSEHGDVSDWLEANTVATLELLAQILPTITGELDTAGGQDAPAVVQYLEARVTELEAWKQRVTDLLLGNSALHTSDRVGLFAYQQLCDELGLTPGTLAPVVQKDLAARWHVSEDTVSNWLDRWEGMGLARHDVRATASAVLDRHGRPKLDRATGQPRVHYDTHTTLSCAAAPFEVEIAVLQSPPGKKGKQHGGKRECPNCHSTENQQDARYCKTCHHVYDAQTGQALDTTPVAGPQDAPRPADTPTHDEPATPETAGGKPSRSVYLSGGKMPPGQAPRTPATASVRNAGVAGASVGAPSLRIAADAARELQARAVVDEPPLVDEPPISAYADLFDEPAPPPDMAYCIWCEGPCTGLCEKLPNAPRRQEVAR